MGAAKTFSEWWRSMGPIDYKMDRRSAEIAWDAAQKAVEIAPSASHNSSMVAICAYHKPNWSCPFHAGGFCDSNGCNEAPRIQRQ